MSPRYLLIVGDDVRNRPGVIERLAFRTKLELAYSTAHMAVFANSGCRCIPIGEGGCVLGWLFRRHGPAQQLSSFSGDEAALIAATAGQELIPSFWGGYVAAVVEGDSVRILRDPSGAFPCYYADAGLHVTVASDAELLHNAGDLTVHVDLEEIGRQLYRAFIPNAATALEGIRELLAGFALKLPSLAHDQEPCWSPWEHVSWRAALRAEAAERLSWTVHHCVDAWASVSKRLLLSVSGGLDSSIVAACLARSGAETVCVTMFTDEPSGDERMFARRLCDQLGLQLIERAYRLDQIDIRQPLAAHLPRPRDRTQALAFEHVHRELAAVVGADAFMSGNGGDNVFGYSQSAAPIADLYLTHGVGKRTLEAMFDVCRQTGCSISDAVAQAWRLARAPADYQVRPNPLFLHSDIVGSFGAAELEHPWLEAPSLALPGKAAHIATVLRLQPCVEADRGNYLPVFNPLISQPLVEECLAVPSWEWRAGGRDRSLARSAFAGELPSAILNRRVKGTPGRFAAQLLDHFRASIRERLLGGHLAAHRIVDARALEQTLAGDRPVPDLQRVRILELVNVEAWVDHWIARGWGTSSAEPDITCRF